MKLFWHNPAWKSCPSDIVCPHCGEGWDVLYGDEHGAILPGEYGKQTRTVKCLNSFPGPGRATGCGKEFKLISTITVTLEFETEVP